LFITCSTSLWPTKYPLDSITLFTSWALIAPSPLISSELKASYALKPGLAANLYLNASAAFSTLIWVLHID
jgi:hypothetical protein